MHTQTAKGDAALRGRRHQLPETRTHKGLELAADFLGVAPANPQAGKPLWHSI